MKEVLKAMGIPIMTLEGYEADDILGTLSKKFDVHSYAKKAEAEKDEKPAAKKETAKKSHAKNEEKPVIKAVTDKKPAPKAKKEDADEKLPDDVESIDTEEEEEAIEQKQRSGIRYYHVSLRDDDKWQVKLSKGDKAIKLFDKQSEAIEYARELARSNHGHIVIHRVNGKIRKTRY